MIFLVVAKDQKLLVDKFQQTAVELTQHNPVVRNRTLQIETDYVLYQFIHYKDKFSVMGKTCNCCVILDLKDFNLEEISYCLSRERLFE